ncbi:MAG: hypothetical protein ACIPMY_03065 [Rickettsia endosymbiont of Pentastiridius leporinus]
MEAVIDEINRSINTSFTIHSTADYKLTVKNLKNQRVKVLQENSNNPLFKNLKFIPPFDITWQEFANFKNLKISLTELIKNNSDIRLVEKPESKQSGNIITLLNNLNIKALIKNIGVEKIDKWSKGEFQNIVTLVENNEDIKKLIEAGISIEKIDKYSEGKLENIEFLTNNLGKVKNLKYIFDPEKIDKWIDEKFENIEFLINNLDNIEMLWGQREIWQELQEIMLTGTIIELNNPQL